MSPVNIKREVDNEDKTMEQGNEAVSSLSSSTLSCRRRSSEPNLAGTNRTSSTAPDKDNKAAGKSGTTGWDVMYRILKAYFDKYGHTQVQQGPNGQHKLLETWVKQQRHQWNEWMGSGGTIDLGWLRPIAWTN